MEAAFGSLHNSGAGAFGDRPTFAESIVVDGETGGSTYGTIYATISGSKMGATIDHPSGTITEQLRVIRILGTQQCLAGLRAGLKDWFDQWLVWG